MRKNIILTIVRSIFALLLLFFAKRIADKTASYSFHFATLLLKNAFSDEIQIKRDVPFCCLQRTLTNTKNLPKILK